MTVTDELKPCPFCGSANLMRSELEGIKCQNCRTHVISAGTASDAEAWNRRAEAAQGAVQALDPYWLVTFADGRTCKAVANPGTGPSGDGVIAATEYVKPNALHPTPAHSGEREALERAARRLIDSDLAEQIRKLVAGWNGEGVPEEYRMGRHDDALGVTLPTNCGAIYMLDEVLSAFRAALEAKP